MFFKIFPTRFARKVDRNTKITMQSDFLYNNKLPGDQGGADSVNDFDDDMANINGAPMDSNDIQGKAY